MHKPTVWGAALLMGCAVTLMGGSGDDKPAQMLEFKTMVGVPKSYTAGSGNTINGVAGGGLPWVISAAAGELTVDGHLEIAVTGLVFDPSDPDVQARGLANTNPLTSFRAIVSCRTVGGGTTNLTTGAFPATTGPVGTGGGNARIDAWVQLPKPCIAPVVFVTSAGGAWLAATGF